LIPKVAKVKVDRGLLTAQTHTSEQLRQRQQNACPGVLLTFQIIYTPCYINCDGKGTESAVGKTRQNSK
jgi:hypothetical protein